MNEVEQTVKELFEPGGRLSQLLPGYEYREVQVELALLVVEAIQTQQYMFGEGGTGCGKSFSSVAPAILASHSGSRIVVSTESNSLLDQYYTKDLPFLANALEPYRHFTFAKAKGKNNFVCKNKLDEFVGQQSLALDIHIEEANYKNLIEWTQNTVSGDKGEIPFRLDPAIWALISCEDICKKKGCGYYKSGACFFQKARQLYRNATVVITNHTLYLLDAQADGHIIGAHDIVIFDEGHALAECAQNTLGTSITSRTISGFVRYVHSQLSKLGIWPDPVDYKAMLGNIERVESELWSAFNMLDVGKYPLEKLNILMLNMAKTRAEEIENLLSGVRGAIAHATRHPNYDIIEMEDLIEGIRNKLSEHMGNLSALFIDRKDDEGDWCTYLEIENAKKKNVHMAVHRRPVDVAPILQKLLWNSKSPITGEAKIQSAIFTSATLAVAGSFEYQKRELGIDSALTTIVGSPFNFQEQMYGWFPRDMVIKDTNNHPEYWQALADEVIRICKVTDGRAFVLFTSYKDMEEVYNRVIGQIPYRILKQKDMSRQNLLDEFKQDIHSVLFGTSSFWTGIDVPGEALSCVIIIKMPFRVPTDPLYDAKCKLIQKRGGDWFNGYAVPIAISDLRQGVGRLIRTRTDKGLFAFLDSRIFRKPYGRAVFRSLPPMKILDNLPEQVIL